LSGKERDFDQKGKETAYAKKRKKKKGGYLSITSEKGEGYVGNKGRTYAPMTRVNKKKKTAAVTLERIQEGEESRSKGERGPLLKAHLERRLENRVPREGVGTRGKEESIGGSSEEKAFRKRAVVSGDGVGRVKDNLMEKEQKRRRQ